MEMVKWQWVYAEVGYKDEYLRYGLNIQGLPRHSVGESALSYEGGAYCEEVVYNHILHV